MIHGLVDRLAAVYAAGVHQGEAILARDEYFERAGKVFDDDGELFESRMASFLEWYVIERPFRGGPPPVLQALAELGELGAAERSATAFLAASQRSLYDLVALEDHTVELEDVVYGGRFRVLERRSTRALELGDLFEARLMWDGRSAVFGRTFLFHPRDARNVILGIVGSAVSSGARREEILFQLARLHVRWHRYGHISAAKIYRGEAG